MAPFRFHGPICQTKDCYEEIDDGTLARIPSAAPSTVGSRGQSQAPPPLASNAYSFLNPRQSGTVRAPQEAFDRLRGNSGSATISSPKARASQAWPDGSSSAAVEQEIRIDNQSIRVVRPTDADATGKNLPMTAQLAEALRAIPAVQRSHTTIVVLSPRPHPDSTPTQTVAGQGGSGEIDLFPVNSPQSQNDFDNRLTHESGHNYQGSFWQSGADVHEWQTAAAADNRLPSPYAGATTGDDFSEFNILYNAARGTPCEASARQLYPNRWTKMV